jgi:hypothetical protein
VTERNLSDFALQKFEILDPGLALVLLRQGQHFIGHINA